MTMLGTTDIRANRNRSVIGKRRTDLAATAGNGRCDGGEATSRIGFPAMAVKTWSCKHMPGWRMVGFVVTGETGVGGAVSRSAAALSDGAGLVCEGLCG